MRKQSTAETPRISRHYIALAVAILGTAFFVWRYAEGAMNAPGAALLVVGLWSYVAWRLRFAAKRAVAIALIAGLGLTATMPTQVHAQTAAELCVEYENDMRMSFLGSGGLGGAAVGGATGLVGGMIAGLDAEGEEACNEAYRGG